MTDQEPQYVGDEEAKQVTNIPEPQKPLLPLDEGVAGRDQEIEEQRQSELDAAREEHNRLTGGGKYPLSSER